MFFYKLSWVSVTCPLLFYYCLVTRFSDFKFIILFLQNDRVFSCYFLRCQSSSIQVFSIPWRNFLPLELNTWENKGRFDQILFQEITTEGLNLFYALLYWFTVTFPLFQLNILFVSMNCWKTNISYLIMSFFFFFLSYLSHLSRNHAQTAGRLHIKNYFSVRKISFYNSVLLFENFTF